MKKFIILTLVITAIASIGCDAKTLNFGKETKRCPKAVYNKLKIKFSVFRDAIRWCRTSGGLKSIVFDPNKGYLYRYICKAPRHTLNAGYKND